MKIKRRKRVAPRFKKKTTRITIDFPTAQHRKLKAIAALKGVTLQEYIRSQVSAELEESYISDDELKPIVKKIINEHEDALKRLADK